MEKFFEIWSEGFVCSGGIGHAEFHGAFKGKTFKDAVISWKNYVTNDKSKYIDVDKLQYINNNLFDNETDARKKFG